MAADPDLASANQEFALNFYRTITSSSSSSNVCISPFCLHSVLSMTYLGAEGNTKAELESGLKLNSLKDGVTESYRRFLTKEPTDSVNVANRLYVNSVADIFESFKQTCNVNFKADAVTCKFDADADAERISINDWVKQETNGKIEDLLPAGSVSMDTAMVLVNAIYFKDNWHTKFDVKETCKGQFRLSETESVEVDFMSREGSYNFGFSRELNAQILELPYQDKKLSMFVIIPYDGLQGLEENLNASTLSEIEKEMYETKVEVRLPKFKVNTSMELTNNLQSLGIKDAFVSGIADFTKMAESRNVFLSSVFHKAFIIVDEEGSEAAAAGGVVANLRRLPPSFIADQPFLFYIKENASGMILFIGRVTNPESQ